MKTGCATLIVPSKETRYYVSIEINFTNILLAVIY